jgi:hypothetical protein
MIFIFEQAGIVRVSWKITISFAVKLRGEPGEVTT